MTKIKLSSFSRPATEIAPSDSGSSISPSPKYAQTVRLSVCLISEQGADLIFFQGHISPGIYSRAFLEGRITEAQMLLFLDTPNI
jgi:hypothetical protein